MGSTSHSIVSLFLLFLTASAFPIKPQETQAIRRRAAYSVVAVDGGAAASSTPNAASSPSIVTIIQTSDETVTVTAAAITVPPSIETIVATQIVTDLEPARTVEIIVTHDITKTASLPPQLKYVVVNDDTPPADTVPTTTSTALKSTSTSSSEPTSSAVSMSTSVVSCTSTDSGVRTSSGTLASTQSGLSAIMSTYGLPIASMPSSEALVPEEKGWSPPAELVPLSSTTSSILSTYTTATSASILTEIATTKTYDDGMWHTNQPTGTKLYDNGVWHTTYPWHATSTTSSSSSATASATSGAYPSYVTSSKG